MNKWGSPYCFNKETEYQLWLVDDMKDVSERDNHGIAYTNIYIKP